MKNLKSYEDFVLGLYGAMLSDIADYDPRLRRDCDRDLLRLLSLINHRGLTYCLTTMPDYCKHLDKCLESECLTSSGLAGFGSFRRRGVIPRLFKGLHLRIFDECGALRSEFDSRYLVFLRQLLLVVKRFRLDCPDHATWKSVHEFFETDSEVRSGTLDWCSTHLDTSSCPHLSIRDGFEELSVGRDVYDVSSDRHAINCGGALSYIQLVGDIVSSQLGVFHPSEWHAKHGPGAVSDLRPNEFKYSFPNWPDKLDSSFPVDLFGFANYDHWLRWLSRQTSDSLDLHSVESPARLLAVPKTFSGPRLIASEPVSHQWCQQIIRDFLASRVKYTSLSPSIDFRSQLGNQDLAREASLTGDWATIDLSAASDRISCWLIERLFRVNPSLLQAFHAVRTSFIQQSLDRKLPKLYKLKKFSTMGSAITFPVQTYVFSIISVGCLLSKRHIRPTISSIRQASQEVRVYGDDIIVPTDICDLVKETLTTLGLKVNPLKTFGSGNFRESCGFDGFRGDDVTKVSVLSAPSVSAPESVLSCVDVHNNFFRRGWYKTSEYVRRRVESLGRYFFREVAPDSGAIGWSSFDCSDSPSLKRRWNRDLQRAEIRITLPTGSAKRSPVDSDSMVLQYFTEVTKPPISNEIRLGCYPSRYPLKLRWVWVPVVS